MDIVEFLRARMAQALDQALWSVKVVASVYANHPDYDESWRP